MKNVNSFLLPENILKRISHPVLGVSEKVEHLFNFLDVELKHSELKIEKIDYLSYCISSSFFYFILFSLLAFFITGKIMTIFFVFILIVLNFIRLVNYPKFVAAQRVKRIEKDLLIVLRNMLVQINSNIPLFDIITNVADQDFGEVSREFRRIVKKINSGVSETIALEESATNTPSIFFRTVLWQLINGIKAGSNIGVVLKDLIAMLSGEQIDQIQEYGASLNSLSMFYMLLVIIMPALAITFLIAGSAFFANAQSTMNFLLWMTFFIVILFQIIFLGVIKAKRPSLLRI